MAQPLNRDRAPLEAVAAPLLVRRRLNGAEHPVCRHARRVARLRTDAGHVLRLHMHEVHVLDRRTDVFRRDVAAAQRIDETPMRSEQHLAVGRLVVADNDRLAAAKIEAGHGIFVRHAAREPQGVDDRRVFGGVVPEAAAAKCGPERGVVDRNDTAIPGRFVMAEHHLLMAHLGDFFEVLHKWEPEDQSGRDPSCAAAAASVSRAMTMR